MWEVLYLIVSEPLFLPSPKETLLSVCNILSKINSWAIIGKTATKMLFGYFMALVLGISLACVASRFFIIEELFKPLIILTKSIPVASFIVLVLAWLSSKNISIFICLLVVFPTVYFSVFAAIKRVDVKLLELCAVYNVSTSKRFRYIYAPEVAAELTEVVKITVGMGIRSSIAAELIGLPENSLGAELYKAKLYFDIGDLFAWTIFAVLLCFILEKTMIMAFSELNKVFQKA